jgi:hypothetical protein
MCCEIPVLPCYRANREHGLAYHPTPMAAHRSRGLTSCFYKQQSNSDRVVESTTIGLVLTITHELLRQRRAYVGGIDICAFCDQDFGQRSVVLLIGVVKSSVVRILYIMAVEIHYAIVDHTDDLVQAALFARFNKAAYCHSPIHCDHSATRACQQSNSDCTRSSEPTIRV